ncbi:MAG: hypothetical protein QOF78_2122 [Phycisphaerales bacterium]|jgi:hypothetical protein|nr:hypothetical protein [Phycisphaerales bacterium]
MARKGRVKSPTKMLTAAVIAIIAICAAATSPARAREVETPSSSSSFDGVLKLEDDEQSVTWPEFSDALDDQSPPVFIPPTGWAPQSLLTSTAVVTAPLPQAVVSGIFMLAGNWVVTYLWKKRKI